MPTVLLHTCCAPCASVCIERLRADDLAVTLFFSNANIGDGDEYARRLEAVVRLSEALSVPLLVDETTRHDDWLAAVRGFESAREGGARCRPCFAREWALLPTVRVLLALGLLQGARGLAADAVDLLELGHGVRIALHQR